MQWRPAGHAAGGELTDTAQSKRVNCKKIIFIFTTNAFDPTIMQVVGKKIGRFVGLIIFTSTFV